MSQTECFFRVKRALYARMVVITVVYYKAQTRGVLAYGRNKVVVGLKKNNLRYIREEIKTVKEGRVGECIERL